MVAAPLWNVLPARGHDLADELVVRKVLPEGVAHPVVEVEDRFDSDPVGIRPQQVEPFIGPDIRILGRLSSRSTSIGRFSGDGSARKSRTSSGDGCRPMMSSETRRRYVESLAGWDGRMPSRLSLVQTCSSIKFARGRSA